MVRDKVEDIGNASTLLQGKISSTILKVLRFLPCRKQGDLVKIEKSGIN